MCWCWCGVGGVDGVVIVDVVVGGVIVGDGGGGGGRDDEDFVNVVVLVVVVVVVVVVIVVAISAVIVIIVMVAVVVSVGESSQGQRGDTKRTLKKEGPFRSVIHAGVARFRTQTQNKITMLQQSCKCSSFVLGFPRSGLRCSFIEGDNVAIYITAPSTARARAAVIATTSATATATATVAAPGPQPPHTRRYLFPCASASRGLNNYSR